MIDTTLIPWLLAGIPLLGAVLSPVLWAIAGILLLRGVAGVGIALFRVLPRPAFWWWSSSICLAMGGLHAVGAMSLGGNA